LPASQYERKIKLLNTAVEMGVAKAEDSLGQVYYTLGEASLENNDVNKAVEYLEQAQQHGLLKAKKLLGQCYYSLALKSQGEEKVRLLRKATKNDNDEARQILGEYYLETGSEAHNISTLEKASVLGNKDAMEKLSTYYNQKGAQYFSGDGVERDLEKAQEYFTKASDLGDESARKNLSVLYNRIGVYYYQGNEQVNPDYVKAEEYFKQATELGNKDAMENLGTLYNQYGDQYHSGDRVKRNYEIAEEFYLKAIKNGNEQAKKSLIMVYVTCYFNYKHGINGYVRDNVKANSYLSKARHTNPEMLEQIAKEYHTKAQQLIAHGINHHNYKMINSYLKKSSRLGKDDLTQELIDFYKAVALCYKKGNNGFDKDKSRANSYIRKAAELGDEEAIKKYKPTKQHKSLVKTAFESITGTSTVALKRAKNKGNYSYYYKDYND
jgi:TPR repeat protein